jgi:ElaB/YqjD/DUF883 family membrane-anchored ribosome-binding protein
LSSTETESKGVRQEIEDLKKAVEVQAATQAGANATQVATHAGTWSTMIAGAAGLVVGLFLGVAITAVRS